MEKIKSIYRKVLYIKMSDNFEDSTISENVSQIIEKINLLDNPESIQKYIDEILPNWLVYSLDNYSNDYPHLRNNWVCICQKCEVSPQKIILVSSIMFDENHRVVLSVCDFMTKLGYVVRRAGEFIACSVCMLAIPCEEVWQILKNKNFRVPEVWSSKCSNCS